MYKHECNNNKNHERNTSLNKLKLDFVMSE